MPRWLAYQLYHLLTQGLDLLCPPSCGGCGRRGVRWCDQCNYSVEQINPPFCDVCGQNYLLESELCNRCKDTRPNYQALRSWAVFDGKVRNALHRMKYRRDTGLGEALSIPLIDYLKRLGWKIDIVVPVPLGTARMVERGYNQAALLAQPLAYGLGYRYMPKTLQRVKETRSQVGLSAVSRRENVAGAFKANPDLCLGMNILIVDDVTTSGATLDSSAAALCAAGAKSVYGLTLARAVLNSSEAIST